MRPAQKAPENGAIGWFGAVRINASMRPAQKAPENKTIIARVTEGDLASMRPAQKAPENVKRTDWRAFIISSLQ